MNAYAWMGSWPTWLWVLLLFVVWALGMASAIRAYFLGYKRAEEDYGPVTAPEPGSAYR